MKNMKSLMIALGCALAFAAVGCGDDSDKNEADSGTDAGPTAGKGGGGAGESGSVTQCTTDTVKAGAPETCARCVCEKATAKASACAADTNCWALIDCVAKNCPVDQACALTTCKTFTAGYATAMGLADTLNMDCKDMCKAPASGNDGGTDDGGGDAGQ